MKRGQAITRQQFVYFTEDGSIECINEKAHRWFHFYFGIDTSRGRLPDVIAQWVRNSRQAVKKPGTLAECEPFIFRKENRFLIFQFPNNDPTHSLILITEGYVNKNVTEADCPLTLREREVLNWICSGKTNPEIAVILDISPRTVHKHVERILEKLGVENRHAAVAHLMERTSNGKKKKGRSR